MECGICYEEKPHTLKCSVCIHELCRECRGKVKKCPYCRTRFACATTVNYNDLDREIRQFMGTMASFIDMNIW